MFWASAREVIVETLIYPFSAQIQNCNPQKCKICKMTVVRSSGAIKDNLNNIAQFRLNPFGDDNDIVFVGRAGDSLKTIDN